MNNKTWFLKGLKNGIPIMAGYFAVAFALGITAKNIGMNAFQSFYMSLTMVASAGQFAAITLIASAANALEMILTSFIVNLRYFLMSCSVTQKLSPNIKPIHRFGIAFFMTDEIFGLESAVTGCLNPFYTYGMGIISVVGWCTGTVLGAVVGNLLPLWVSNALNVALYGMFLAIIIPPAKKNRFIAGLAVISMAMSYLFSVLPLLSEISSGFRIIILTVIIAGIAAIIRPVDDDAKETSNEKEVSFE